MVDERQHSKLLVQGVGGWTFGFVFLKYALAHLSFLRFQRPLGKNGLLQLRHERGVQLLLFADGMKLFEVVFVACGVVFAYLFAFLIELVEIIAKVFASRFPHFFGEGTDTVIHDAHVLTTLILAVAEKATALGKVIENATEDVAVRNLGQIQFLMQA